MISYVHLDLGHGPGNGDPSGVDGPVMSEREAIEQVCPHIKSHLARFGVAVRETHSGKYSHRADPQLDPLDDARIHIHFNGGGPKAMRTPYAQAIVHSGDVASYQLARELMLALGTYPAIKRCIISTMNTGEADGTPLADTEHLPGFRLEHMAWSNRRAPNVMDPFGDVAPRALLEVCFMDREEHAEALSDLDVLGELIAGGILAFLEG